MPVAALTPCNEMNDVFAGCFRKKGFWRLCPMLRMTFLLERGVPQVFSPSISGHFRIFHVNLSWHKSAWFLRGSAAIGLVGAHSRQPIARRCQSQASCKSGENNFVSRIIGFEMVNSEPCFGLGKLSQQQRLCIDIFITLQKLRKSGDTATQTVVANQRHNPKQDPKPEAHGLKRTMIWRGLLASIDTSTRIICV